MSGKELSIDKQNRIIHLRKLIEDGVIRIPDPDVYDEFVEELRGVMNNIPPLELEEGS